MRDLLTQYPVIAYIFIACIAGVTIFLFVKAMQTIGMEKARAYIYKLFVEAENAFQQGDNTEKFEYVIQFSKSAIPSPFNLFITEKTLRKVIQLWFDLCKDLLDDGKLNKSEKESE